MTHRRRVAFAAISLFVLVAAACSDVEDEPEADGAATGGDTS